MKQEGEIKLVNDHGLLHPLCMSDNIQERRQIFKHAIESMRMKLKTHYKTIFHQGSSSQANEKLQQQSKQLREYKKIQHQEKELLNAIQTCTEKLLTQHQHYQIIERILNSVTREMNDYIGREDYSCFDLEDHNLNHTYSMGCEALNLDVTFTDNRKTLHSISFQKTKTNSEHKEIRAISDDLLNTLKENNYELFEKKLLDVCKLYHLVGTRQNCIVTDKSLLRGLDTSSSDSFLQSSTIMREFEQYIIKEGNFPTESVAMKCEGLCINFYKDKNVVITLEGCGGNALNQTCPVMIFSHPVQVPLFMAKNFNYIPSNPAQPTQPGQSAQPEDVMTDDMNLSQKAEASILSHKEPYWVKDESQELVMNGINQSDGDNTRILETFQACLLSNHSAESVKKVQSSIYNFVSCPSNIQDRMPSNTGTIVTRVPFLTFQQMRDTITSVKRQLYLNDLLLSCFSSKSGQSSNNHSFAIPSIILPIDSYRNNSYVIEANLQTVASVVAMVMSTTNIKLKNNTIVMVVRSVPCL